MKFIHFCVFIGATIFLGACTNERTEAEPAAPPNFLFLFADDMAYNAWAAAGNEHIATPNLDQLAREGFTFTHAFNQGSWSGAVCVVSRAMLNSGRFIYHARSDIQTVSLWGEEMQKNGYHTFMTGKWHNGDATVLKSFDQAMSIGKGMFETKGGPKGDGYRRPTPTHDSWSPSDTSLLGHWSPMVKDIVVTDSGKAIGETYVVKQHTSELYADHAIEYLKRYGEEDPDHPFFMYVAFNAPHDPRQAPQSFVDKYPEASLPLPANYMEEHPFDQGERYTLRDEILGPFPRTPDAVRRHIQEYYAIITHMDEQIGRILAALDEKGLRENTYIIFTADHGLAVGSHGLMGKQNAYDHSIRVPLVFSGPGIPEGANSDELVYLQSIFPTSLTLGNMNIPDHVEFADLSSLLLTNSGIGEEAIFGSYKDFQRMVRTKEFKYILYPEANEVQLFNMKEDPDERRNLANSADLLPVREELHALLVNLQERVGDTLSLKEIEPN